MLHQNLFMHSPGDINEGGNINANINEEGKTDDEFSSAAKEKPSLLKKIKDALQDWSNDDQREQQSDDSRP